MLRKLGIAGIFAILLSLGMVGLALALTIVVDGVREAAWDAGGSVTDPNEPGITNDGVDILSVGWTNNTANFYFLFETYTATDWNRFPDPPYIYLCINTDNNLATGSSFPNVCLSTGYDRYVRISGPTPLSVMVLDAAFAPVTATTSVATQGNVTELAVNLAALGLGPGNCGMMPTGIYMDGRTADPDDNVLDVGDVPVTCGPPTAVTVTSLQAQPTSSPILPVALVGASAAALIGIVFLTRRGHK